MRHRPSESSSRRQILAASRPSRRTPSTALAPTLALALAMALAMAALTAAHAQVGAGDRLVDEGRFEDAVARYDEAIATDASNAAAYRQRARAQVYWADDLPSGEDDAKQRLYDLAIADAERAVALAPDDPGTHFEVARALGRAAQYRGVLASLNLAARVSDALDLVLEMDPEHAAAWHALALYHHEVPWIAGGRAGRVVPSFERAIELEPDEISHRVGLAGVLIDRERYDEAETQLEVALARTPRTYLDEQDLAEARALEARLP